MNDLEFLEGLAIETFGNYGGRVADFEFLRNLPSLKRLWLKTNATLENVDFVEDLVSLERLELYYLAKITRIPNLDNHKRLRQVVAFDCNRLTDISSVKGLPKGVHVAASGKALKKGFVTKGLTFNPD